MYRILCVLFLMSFFATAAQPRRQFDQFVPVKRLGHGEINSAALSPDGKLLALASVTDITLYNPDNFELIDFFSSEAGNVTSITWSPDSQVLVAGTENGVLILWEVKTGALLRTFSISDDAVFHISWLAGGTTIAAGMGNFILVLNSNTGEEILRIAGGKQYAMWSPDGLHMLYITQDNRVNVIRTDRQTGLPINASEIILNTDASFPVQSVVWSPDGQYYVTEDGRWTIQDIETGQPLSSLEATGQITDAAWSPDGSQVAIVTFDYSLYLWDMTGGSRQYQLERPQYVYKTDLVFVEWVDDKLVAGSTGGTWQTLDAKTGRVMAELPENLARLESPAWSYDGKYLAAKSMAGEVLIWNSETWELVATSDCPNHYSIDRTVWSPDTYTLAITCSSLQSLEIDYSHEAIKIIKFYNRALEWSPDGSQIAIGYDDTTIGVLDSNSLQTLFILGESCIPPPGSTEGGGCAPLPMFLNWSPDGQYLAVESIGQYSGIDIWKLETREVIHQIEFASGLLWSPDGDRFGVYIWGYGKGDAFDIWEKTSFTAYTRVSASPADMASYSTLWHGQTIVFCGEASQLMTLNATTLEFSPVLDDTGNSIDCFYERSFVNARNIQWASNNLVAVTVHNVISIYRAE